MEALKKKILTDGMAMGTDIVKVDSFLNHQIDVAFMNEIGKEFARLFSDVEITKLLPLNPQALLLQPLHLSILIMFPLYLLKRQSPEILTLTNIMEKFIPSQNRKFILL